jgi:hypothetical protein
MATITTAVSSARTSVEKAHSVIFTATAAGAKTPITKARTNGARSAQVATASSHRSAFRERLCDEASSAVTGVSPPAAIVCLALFVANGARDRVARSNVSLMGLDEAAGSGLRLKGKYG